VRHASLLSVAALLGRHNPHKSGVMFRRACDGERDDCENMVTAYETEKMYEGTLEAEQVPDCERCRVILDAALERQNPFPFELPGLDK